MIKTSIAFAFLVALPLTASQAGAPADATQYPEMARDRALPDIFDALRRFLNDSASITDFALCEPPVKIKFKDNRPVRWTYMFSLNSRNGAGGYTGVQHYAAIFRPGKVDITALAMPGSEGFDSIVNAAIDKQMRKCPFLPNAEVQVLLARR